MTISPDASLSSGQLSPPPIPIKKKRNLPGTPDPDAEVVALSPTTLMATNRFVCEICGKGFQRDQNLQLHRRGHNLPWKLKQRTDKDLIRKKVYVCPEPSCVHHDPSRALGDLTGIKKHFSRKHGEKKWRCDKCSKKYAVQSDWKAHLKVCGTKEYRCDCGTIFSRRDSFVTHRAFCDVLAEEASVKAQDRILGSEEAVAAVVKEELPIQSIPPPKSEDPDNPDGMLQYMSPTLTVNNNSNNNCNGTTSTSSNSNCNGNPATLFASLFSSATGTASAAPSQSNNSFTELISSIDRPELISLSLSAPNSSLFSLPPPPPPPPSPHLSATALLQKAAQMGATANGSSLLREFGLATSSSSHSSGNNNNEGGFNWNSHRKLEHHEPPVLSAGLGLGLPDLMMGASSSSSLFGSKPATLDLLGLGIGPALMNSIGNGLDLPPGASSANTSAFL